MKQQLPGTLHLAEPRPSLLTSISKGLLPKKEALEGVKYRVESSFMSFRRRQNRQIFYS